MIFITVMLPLVGEDPDRVETSVFYRLYCATCPVAPLGRGG